MLNEIKEFVASREDEMFDLLERLVNINSWSYNPKGTEKVAQVLIPLLEELGFTIRRVKQTEVADTLIAENTARLEKGGGVLISGHMDTVFPEESGFLEYKREGDKVSGPGTADMKSGVVGAVYSLKALDKLGLLKDMPIAVIFNSDEEIGSRFSRPIIEDLARQSDLAFVYEPSRLDGAVTTGRKGKMTYWLYTEGKAGHAGSCPHPKSSAIEELCNWVVELEALNDPEAERSLNTGTISGGVGVNTIPFAAEGEIECRWKGTEDGDAFLKAIEDTTKKTVVDGTKRSLKQGFGRPAMETGPSISALYDIASDVAGELSLPIAERFGGGVSDANFMADVGTPVLDGLGPSGTNFHSPEEYMSAKTMVERTVMGTEIVRRAWEKFRAQGL